MDSGNKPLLNTCKVEGLAPYRIEGQLWNELHSAAALIYTNSCKNSQLLFTLICSDVFSCFLTCSVVSNVLKLWAQAHQGIRAKKRRILFNILVKVQVKRVSEPMSFLFTSN
jgi:hypothetical protein